MATISEEVQTASPETKAHAPQADSTPVSVLTAQPLSLRLFTVAEYDKMITAGILDEDERVELLEGVIRTTSPKGDAHATATDRATRCFIKLLDNRALVRNQNPIHLSDNSEPEPDIVLAVPQEKEYSDRKPQPKDILLILEVADTTLRTDRQKKGDLYAHAGIGQYLILNLKARELEDYREPGANGYRSKQTYSAWQSFNLVAFPEVAISVDELPPPV